MPPGHVPIYFCVRPLWDNDMKNLVIIIAFALMICGCSNHRSVICTYIHDEGRFYVKTQSEIDNIEMSEQNPSAKAIFDEIQLLNGGKYVYLSGLALDNDTLKLDGKEYQLSISESGKNIIWFRR